MIICTTPRLEDMPATIADHYNARPEQFKLEPAPGDADRWFVTRDGYVMSGLHVVKRGSFYHFKLIGF